jgi:opacity protein-like surface antigen
VEGTAGVAHLRFGARGLGSTSDALIRAALDLVDTRDPIFGAGGGVLVQAGPLQVDLGYRYKKIVTNSVLSNIIGAGQDMQSHQVRVGAGVRF